MATQLVNTVRPCARQQLVGVHCTVVPPARITEAPSGIMSAARRPIARLPSMLVTWRTAMSGSSVSSEMRAAMGLAQLPPLGQRQQVAPDRLARDVQLPLDLRHRNGSMRIHQRQDVVLPLLGKHGRSELLRSRRHAA